ncbi:auxin response factor 23-like [Bidens hawaiensis]|uniref:auxin response factor 23-like n=1 Tax=Bidens hawaiensis TaxID=980011 RepID=UPI00404B4F22
MRGKKLKAGDTCIFMKGLHQGEFYIGVKRAVPVSIQTEFTDLSGLNMRRGVLLEASVAMTTGCNFTVLYHPRMCTSPFMVPYNIVMEALEMNYVPGMRCEMLCNGDDPEHIIRFSGTITSRGDSDPVKWPSSDWRCLEVKWDALSSSDVLPSRVSPWEIRPLGLYANRSMPFEPVICNIPFLRTNGNYQSGGLQSQGLTLDIGSSSHPNDENMDDID